MEYITLALIFFILIGNLVYEIFLAPGPLENLPDLISDKKEEDSLKEE